MFGLSLSCRGQFSALAKATSFGKRRFSDAAKRLFVSNFPYTVTAEDLKDHFKQNGFNVNASIIMAGGVSKGCSVVEFASQAEALQASKQLNRTTFFNRQLHLREDREKEVGKRVIGNRVRGRLVRVDNLSYMTNWRTLKGHFSACGDIRRCDVSQSEDQRPVFGIVEYHDPESAERAILQLTNTEFMDSIIRVTKGSEEEHSSYLFPHASKKKSLLPTNTTKIFVRNIPSQFFRRAEQIAEHFSRCGEIVEVQLLADKSSGEEATLKALIEFSNVDEAQNAINVMNNSTLIGHELFVRADRMS